jgi:ribosomal protein S21
VEKIPVEYDENEKLKDEIRRLKEELDKAIIVAEKARGTYEKLFK